MASSASRAGLAWWLDAAARLQLEAEQKAATPKAETDEKAKAAS